MIKVNLEKQANARDLGGTVTQDGRTVRSHRLIRSGRLSELTNRDAAELLGHWQVRTVIDLRSAAEISERPDPQWGIVDYYSLPMLNDEQLGFNKPSDDKRDAVFAALVDMTSGPEYTPTMYMLDNYRQFISNHTAQKSIRRFFELALTNTKGALLYHCNGGKDRTGIMTVLLLTALNVAWNDIVQDFMATNDAMRPLLEEKLMELPEKFRTPQGKAVLRMLYLAEPAYLQAARDEMIRLAGSPEGYLKEVIGLSDQAFVTLQRKYLA